MGDNKRWSPLKAALVWFAITLVVGMVVSLIVISARGLLHDNPQERGRLVARGLAPIALVSAAIAYFVQRKRRGP